MVAFHVAAGADGATAGPRYLAGHASVLLLVAIGAEVLGTRRTDVVK